ncbi:alpha/beta hydrolase [Sphingomonas sp.]|uniref:alpha/beta hydrolase n=1 Tax=Sphingomonas sp. TaxID=28214 RepID=UPI003D6D2D3A
MTQWIIGGLIAVGLIVLIGVMLTRTGWTERGGVSRITVAGRIQLVLFRALIPFFAGVNKSLGIAVQPALISRRSIDTPHGAAKLTIYRPVDSDGAQLPVHINFHGGGFIIGYPEQDDVYCRHFANLARCVVINVDYVLAPEHVFPAAVMQSFEVTKWVAASSDALAIDPSRLTIGGSSAGAAIAASVCMLARNLSDLRIQAQILIFGCFDWSQPLASKNVMPGVNQALGPHLMNFFMHLYLPNAADRANELASPLMAADLTGVPRAVVISGAHDLIVTDSRAFAKRLLAAGVEVIEREYPEADHGFTYNGPKPQALEALDLVTQELRRAYA